MQRADLANVRSTRVPLALLIVGYVLVHLFMLDEKAYSPDDPVCHTPPYTTELVTAESSDPSPPVSVLHVATAVGCCFAEQPPDRWAQFEAIRYEYDAKVTHALGRIRIVPDPTHRLIMVLYRQNIAHGSMCEDGAA